LISFSFVKYLIHTGVYKNRLHHVAILHKICVELTENMPCILWIWMTYIMGREDVPALSPCPARRPASPRRARGTAAQRAWSKSIFAASQKWMSAQTQHSTWSTRPEENVLLRRRRQRASQHQHQHPMSIPAARYSRREWKIGQPSLYVQFCCFIKSTLAIWGGSVGTDDACIILTMMYQHTTRHKATVVVATSTH